MRTPLASIIRHAEEIGVRYTDSMNVDLLAEPEELSLIKVLTEFPDMVESRARSSRTGWRNIYTTFPDVSINFITLTVYSPKIRTLLLPVLRCALP